ncbi:unnamed protein product [Rhizoctonia solani]|uniref:Protein kinase domain-containing protein n=1 Tax=Rhizoctonia solani TaxID=456999 RepID=A0A8H3CYT6_9AGAM|nr:unnamed protein product [Rhizoctonia solani]CAE6511218.1 unnamed protein product [Rhizoctonia solani]
MRDHWPSHERDPSSQCRQIRAGLVYIHSKEMVHGDLKPVNIMVSSEGEALIADFGNAILKDLALLFAPTTTFSITHQYAPPEHFSAENIPVATKQSDVYSYGMTVLEILTGEVPFADKNIIWLMRRASEGKLQPNQPSSISGDIWSILLPCWAHDPSKRPPVSNIYFPVQIPDGFKAFGALLSPLLPLVHDWFPFAPRLKHAPAAPLGIQINARELCRIWTKEATTRFSLASFEWFRNPASESESEYLIFDLRSEESLGHPSEGLWFKLGHQIKHSRALLNDVVTISPQLSGLLDPSLAGGSGSSPDFASRYDPVCKMAMIVRKQHEPKASVVFGKKLLLSYLLDILKIMHNEPPDGDKNFCWFYASILVEIMDVKAQGVWRGGDRKLYYDRWGSAKWTVYPGKYDRIMDQIRQLEGGRV